MRAVPSHPMEHFPWDSNGNLISMNNPAVKSFHTMPFKISFSMTWRRWHHIFYVLTERIETR